MTNIAGSDPDLRLDRKIFGPGFIILCAKYNKSLASHSDEEHIRSLFGQETAMDAVMNEFADSLLEYICKISDPAMQDARQCLEDVAPHEHSKAACREATRTLGRVMKILGHAVTKGIISSRVAQLTMEKLALRYQANA